MCNESEMILYVVFVENDTMLFNDIMFYDMMYFTYIYIYLRKYFQFMKRTKEKVEKQMIEKEGEEYFSGQLPIQMKNEQYAFFNVFFYSIFLLEFIRILILR